MPRPMMRKECLTRCLSLSTTYLKMKSSIMTMTMKVMSRTLKEGYCTGRGARIRTRRETPLPLMHRRLSIRSGTILPSAGADSLLRP